MWIFMNDAFLSVVHKDGDETTLLVRARRKGELERIFPTADVQETPRNDYRFRALIPRTEVAQVMSRAIESIDYPNFKASVVDHQRHDAYMGVWDVMYRYQKQAQKRD
jgi:hypothetical protein